MNYWKHPSNNPNGAFMYTKNDIEIVLMEYIEAGEKHRGNIFEVDKIYWIAKPLWQRENAWADGYTDPEVEYSDVAEKISKRFAPR